MKRTRWFLLLLAASAACSRDADPTPAAEVPSARPAPPTPSAEPEPANTPGIYVSVGFTLEDLTSDVGSTQLSLLYEDSTRQAGSLESLVTAVELVTYPERAPVAFEVVAVRSAERLDVNPKTPLESRWYELGINRLPRGANVDGVLWKNAHGFPAVRFNPGHAPVRRHVTICGKTGGAPRAIVELSEAITFAPGSTSLLLSDGAGTACSLVQPDMLTQSALTFDCDPSVWASKHLHIETRAGLVSAKGAVPVGVINAAATSSADVVDTSPRTDDFDFSNVVEWSAHCRTML